MRALSTHSLRTMSLELDNVTIVFQRPGRPPVPAVVGVSLQVDSGQIVGLVGESGSGKSSLGRAAVGLVKPTSGRVLFRGQPVRQVGARVRPRSQLGLQLVFQNPYESLNPRRRVRSQLQDGLAALGTEWKIRQQRVDRLLEQLGLPAGTSAKYPHQFSGGQRQRIAIARALAVSPSILVLDEPLASLDSSAQAQLANLLRLLADENEIGMLLISHDLAIVRHIADRISVMYLGSIVESAPTSEIWELPLHPYTEALIGAIPKADGAGQLPTALRGEVGDPADPPSGCRFHPRCPYAREKCVVETPPLVEVTQGRRVACWLHRPGKTLIRPGDAHAPDLGAPIARLTDGQTDAMPSRQRDRADPVAEKTSTP
jgi:oligopeptide/dipeptide ABC transporter ATP-binding protein